METTAAETTIDTPVTIELAGSDPEGDELEFKVYAPEFGELTFEDDPSTLTYTPAAGFEGEDTFYVIANDGKIDSAAAVVTVTVEGEAPTPTPSPTATPTEEPTQEPTAEPTQEPTEQPTSTPSEDPGDGEELPDTGAGAGTGAALALLLAGGAVVAFVARQRLAARS
ncbi:Ig-like domain-containing protein [Jiangella endophytica]|uniref:Ig-like domain-containing protein n=1 Tax=Jiangella endophytica TaxID=1623398 RepID=UPI0038CC1398